MYRFKKHLLSVVAVTAAVLMTAATADAVDATINVTQKYQTIEGFGGGFMFGMWPYGQPYKDELYDSIFNKAGVNIVRVANFYDPQADTGDVPELPMMKEVKERYPDVKVMMSSWSPPYYLKTSDSIAGTVNGVNQSLKKEDGTFVYDKYADYWYNSVKYFQDGGLKLDWISMQNEPDWPADYEGCYLTLAEGDAASYPKAFSAVYTKLQTLTDKVPMIGPDMTGLVGTPKSYSFSQFVDAMDVSKLAALSHHFYNGETENDMKTARQKAGNATIFQTEWLTNEDVARWDGKIWSWFDHIQVIQRALTVEQISLYNIFALAYKTASTHCFFSQDTVAKTYQTRPIYYGFKHFSKSIKRGWKRVGITATGLQISAYANDDNDRMAVVIINTGAATTVSLKGVPAAIDSGCAYQTTKSGDTQSKKYEEVARFGKTVPAISLDATSITSIELWNAKYSTPVTADLLRKTDAAPVLHAVVEPASIAVQLPVSSGSYTASLFNASGKLIAASSSVATTASSTCRFNKPSAAGVYVVTLDCSGRRMSVPVVVK